MILSPYKVAREHLDIEETREEMIQTPERISGEHAEWAEKMRRHRIREKAKDWKEEDHPGCQISGFLWVSLCKSAY